MFYVFLQQSCVLTIKYAREKKVLRKRRVHLQNYAIFKKKPHVSGPVPFKLLLFKGQWDTPASSLLHLLKKQFNELNIRHALFLHVYGNPI